MKKNETILFGSLKAYSFGFILLWIIPLLPYAIHYRGLSHPGTQLLIAAITIPLLAEIWWARRKKRLLKHLYYFGLVGFSLFFSLYPYWMYEQLFVLDTLAPSTQFYQQLFLAILGLVSSCLLATYFLHEKKEAPTKTLDNRPKW